MASLYSGNDIESQGGTQFVSEIKYFLATDEFQKTKNHFCNTQNKSDKDTFVELVGRVVQISNPVSSISLDTKNFSQSLGQSKDYDVGSNFFSANAVKNSLTSRTPLDFPTRHPRLLICDNGTIRVADDAYVHFANEDAYLGRSQLKYALLFLWLNRFSNFISINSIYTDFLDVLQKRYSENLCSAMQWNTPLVQKRFEQLISDFTYDNVHCYLEEKDIVEDDFTKILKNLSSHLNDALNKNRLITFLQEQNILDALVEKKDSTPASSPSFNSKPSQIIYYGVPGCGKSNKIREQLKDVPEKNKVRVVFHPEYTNAEFIGQILPKVNGHVTYEFTPGPFTQIIKRAYLNPNEHFYLVIEEINRGNAAAIFGDTFQLLDRLKAGETDSLGNDPANASVNTFTEGWSQYFVQNDDVNAYIRGNENSIQIGNICFDSNTAIRLPPNLSILATMNTSDQNVFTLDNAFQRRFDMELVRNEFDLSQPAVNAQYNAEIDDTGIKWGQFWGWINAKITATLKGLSSTEDKRLGVWFVSNVGGIIDDKVFAEKVLKFLWDDVFKFKRPQIFADGIDTLEKLINFFENPPEGKERFDVFDGKADLKAFEASPTL
ncbi:MAG: AAA family ATPase [Fibrobacter sp.]|nr:AAA family ATPase [Fibrobacter sp.]